MALHNLDIAAVGADIVTDGKQEHSTTGISENLRAISTAMFILLTRHRKNKEKYETLTVAKWIISRA
jgi:hypothetical protein